MYRISNTHIMYCRAHMCSRYLLVCMCLCTHAHVCVCAYMICADIVLWTFDIHMSHTYIHTYIQLDVRHTHVTYIHTYIQWCTYECTHVHVWLFLIHTCIHTYLHIAVHRCVHTCIYIYLCVCVCFHSYIHICIYIYIYILHRM